MEPGGSQYLQMGKTRVNPHFLPRREKAGRYAHLCGGSKPAEDQSQRMLNALEPRTAHTSLSERKISYLCSLLLEML